MVKTSDMIKRAYAIIIAGGSGERLWPISTEKRPKQFVRVFGGKELIRHAVDRLAGLIPPERTLVITARRLVGLTRRTLPQIPAANVIGEPCRRDTAPAVAVACALVKRFGGADAVGCILTADHLMTPERLFRATLRDAILAASLTDSIVTMGIEPTCAETAYGYIEGGASVDLGTKTAFSRVRRFVEKPDAHTAERYLATGRFLWNSGMFIWRARTMEAAFSRAAPDLAALIPALSNARSIPAALRRLYPSLRTISIDYAVMEKTDSILVAKSEFAWDDVGSWRSLANHFPADAQGNVCLGSCALRDVGGSIVVSPNDHLTAVMGLKDVVVVHTPQATLVCSRARAHELKALLHNAAGGLAARR